MATSISVFWFRRDLRLQDNAGLYYALKENTQVLPIFIFDADILSKLEDKKDKRLVFIHQALCNLNKEMSVFQSSLQTFYGKPLEVFKQLLEQYPITKVYTNHDYEPSAIQRDSEISSFLKTKGIELKTYKDQSIFEKNEVIKEDGKPYTIFTPYKNKWKSKMTDFYLKSYPTENYFNHFIKTPHQPILSLPEIGFNKVDISFSKPEFAEDIIKNYHLQRDIPSLLGTSRLSIHFRFGTISIREAARIAYQYNDTWLNELIWRDFYMMILYHFPHSEKKAFKPAYDKIKWINNEADFEAWCNGKTGYPIVDAGMRELNETGFMHNRVRMIVASFLVKHLLIDWRWGEAYFAKKLLDFELSSNNGGWQWAASSGCDAAPYFRIFNPYEQTKKFDPDFKYIQKWVPEFQELTYPKPIVDHKTARERVLKVFKEALQEK